MPTKIAGIVQSATTSRGHIVTCRAAYYATRRRLKGGHVPRTHAEAVARTAIREDLLGGARALPPGLGAFVARIAAAAEAHRSAFFDAGGHERKPRLRERLRDFRTERYLDEAERRGLPIGLDLLRKGTAPLRMVSETRTPLGDHVGLVRAQGWAEYSRSYGAPRALAILAGRDDAGLWAVRVPATLRTAEDALAWLEPAPVRRTREAGRRVLRQGDVWIVERPRGCLLADRALPHGLTWDAARRVMGHGSHVALHVPFHAVAIRQSTLAPRGFARRQGD